MTDALKKLIAVVSRLPDREQDALASAFLDDLAADARWESAFASSSGALEQLADEALAEHRTGRALPLDPETL